MALVTLLAALALAQAEAQAVPPPPPPPSSEEVPSEAPAMTVDTSPAPVEAIPQAPLQTDVENTPYGAPQPSAPLMPSDQRIRLLPYNADQIVTLSVSPGFASIVELGDDERIENVVVGNSSAWQVTANKRGDRVIIKPLSGASQSNMIVLTGSRRYVFVLDPFGETSFIMRFTYPQSAPAAVQLAAFAAGATPTYRFRGNKGLFPQAMSDDGRRTVIRWGEQNVLPAIFAMNGRKEQLVNGRMVGNDYVIEGAAPRYKFRYGKAEATATRTLPKRRR